VTNNSILGGIIQGTLDASPFLAHADNPFPAHFTLGGGRMAVIAGANASGKSLIFQILASHAARRDIQPITISIRERTGAGSHEMSGMRRMMMFGDESEQSTGATSIGVAERGFANVISRHQEGHQALLLLDEPELGLSEGYAAAMGQWLAEQSIKLPAEAPGVVVVTHSRALVREAGAALGMDPHFLFMGKQPKSLAGWMAAPDTQTVDGLLELRTTGREGRRAVSALFQTLKNERSKAGLVSKP
jgi:hypothetical protein